MGKRLLEMGAPLLGLKGRRTDRSTANRHFSLLHYLFFPPLLIEARNGLVNKTERRQREQQQG